VLFKGSCRPVGPLALRKSHSRKLLDFSWERFFNPANWQEDLESDTSSSPHEGGSRPPSLTKVPSDIPDALLDERLKGA